MRILPTVVLLAGFHVGARAQTFIVDANNGPGTHYLDIATAVQAVPSGATLRVRPGNYASFTVPDKSLTILGAGTTVSVSSPGLRIAGTSPTTKVVVEGLQFLGSAIVTNCLGTVQLTRISAPAVAFPSDLQVAHSTNVHLHEITVPAPFVFFLTQTVDIYGSRVEMVGCNFTAPTQSTAGAAGHPAVRVVSSRLSVFQTTLLGGDGGSDYFSAFGRGGAGLAAIDSVLDLGRGNTFTGGRGGIDPVTGTGCYYVFASGGPGLELTNSRTRAHGTTLRGGEGPCFVCFSNPCTSFGPPAAVDGTSSLQQVPTAPQMSSTGLLQLGGYVDFRVNAAPNDLALLMLGFSAAHFDLPDLVDFGGILAMPDLPFAVLVTDAHGQATYRLPLPPDFVTDRVMWAQYFTFPGAVLPGKGSNTVTFAVRS